MVKKRKAKTKSFRIKVPKRKPGRILHVTAGQDNWEPTIEEINELRDMFTEAANAPHGGVVVTVSGVQVHSIEI
jgi:hypothetical protein